MGQVAFLTKYRLKEGVVATDGAAGELSIEGKRIRLVPFWRLLLGPEQLKRRAAAGNARKGTGGVR